MEFRAEPCDAGTLLEAIARVTPQSPFNTPAYADACRTPTAQPYALALMQDDTVVSGCLAVLHRYGGWKTRLEVPTTPQLAAPAMFWSGVAGFCRRQKVVELDTQSFAAVAPDFPEIGGAMRRTRRFEYTVDLGSDVMASLSNNHRRSVRKAQKAGLVLERHASVEAFGVHRQMMRASIARRNARGEQISLPANEEQHYALLSHGAGELFQVGDRARTLASVLLLRSPSAVYYHSAGALPEGLQAGASPYLVVEAMRRLAREGIRCFNLGGAGADADGLRRFKKGFGAAERPLEARVYRVMPMHRRVGQRLAARLRRRRRPVSG